MSFFTRVPSPIGELLLSGDEHGLAELRFPPETAAAAYGFQARATGSPEGSDSPLPAASAQLAAYFDGSLRDFQLPLALAGSPFFRRVWEAVRAIPFGETRTYGEIAAEIGRPGAARAVGLANGRNPVPIIVPCHRLIGADGSLTGYGGGLPRKRWLLDHEARIVANA
jgi:methylated-DNA-[protein]-cysteine S-methyltransferase